MGRVAKPIVPRFFKHVLIAPGCWEWQAYRDKDGYGTFALNGSQPIMAHRFSWTIFNGEPGDKMVCHTCDNPACVNPFHLFLGDNSVNQRDSSNKKRHHHSRKTHCPKGHPLCGDNLYIGKQAVGKRGTHRKCKTCHRVQALARFNALKPPNDHQETTLF